MIGGVVRGLRRVVDVLQRSLFDDHDQDAAPTAPQPTRLPPSSGGRASSLGGRRVVWSLRRSRRRSIGFVVGPAGLVVSAPNRASLREIESALQEKARWVVARLDEQAERRVRADAARVVWASGALVAFLGEPLRIVVDPDGAEPTAFSAGGGDGAPAQLRLALPRDAAPERLRDAVHGWLQRRAIDHFTARCRHFEAALAVRVRSVKLSSAKTRWGSATTRGDVRLHWRLIQHEPATIDYVVAHELAHLREMNHGPRFWQAVRSVVPDVDREVARLREAARDASLADDAAMGR